MEREPNSQTRFYTQRNGSAENLDFALKKKPTEHVIQTITHHARFYAWNEFDIFVIQDYRIHYCCATRLGVDVERAYMKFISLITLCGSCCFSLLSCRNVFPCCLVFPCCVVPLFFSCYVVSLFCPCSVIPLLCPRCFYPCCVIPHILFPFFLSLLCCSHCAVLFVLSLLHCTIALCLLCSSRCFVLAVLFLLFLFPWCRPGVLFPFRRLQTCFFFQSSA